jgi:hypothetical protein
MFVRNPCCSELEHTTNFQEPDFLKTSLADLSKLKYQLNLLEKLAPISRPAHADKSRKRT